MAELKLADLLKPFPERHPDYPKLRFEKIISKIQTGDLFEMNNGTKKNLIYASPSIENAFKRGEAGVVTLKGNTNLFKDSNTNTIVKITDIKKTKEFGGGGGSGAGADITKLAESAQCLYSALVFYIFGRQIKLDEPITQEQFKKASKYIITDEKLDNMINNLPDDWIKSSILGANKLFEKYGTLKSSKNFIFHRGSSTVDQIEGSFKRINRGEKAFGDINKWSPADIYIVSKNSDIKKLDHFESIKGLNNEMLSQYNQKDLIGVSLKKMNTTARFSEVNVEKSTKGSTGNVKFYNYTIKANPQATIYDSMDVYIQWGQSTRERMQLRSFGSGDGLSGWQGELKGETANQGKVSLGPMAFIIKQHTGITLPSSADVVRRVKANDQALIYEIYDLSKKLGVDNLPSREDHYGMSLQKPSKWRYSKYLGLLMIDAIMSQNAETRNEIIYDFYSYAGSKSRFSAPYAKIEG